MSEKNRYNKIGIKQTIQIHWMDKTLQMLLAGLTQQEIRSELDDYLSTQMPSGGTGKRGAGTYGMAIGLLASWFSPDPQLVPFRDRALHAASQIQPHAWLPLHWSVMSASYPFWFNTARQVGRLLKLQDSITQNQVFVRLKEIYGDRETVARNARYAVRSFVAWKVLCDTDNKGCYVQAPCHKVSDPSIAALLIEASLHAVPENLGNLGNLINNPGLFPFSLPVMTGNAISSYNPAIEVSRYGLDDELLRLKPNI